MNDTPEQPEQLSAKRLALLKLLREEKQKSSRTAIPALPREPERTYVPLSFAQERLWFLDQLEPGSTAYHVFFFVPLEHLNVPLLEQSINELISRHEMLRTTFPLVDGRPMQAIPAVLTLPLPVVDLGAVPTDERMARARQLIEAQVEQPFDLTQSPPLRVLLLHLSSDTYVLSVVVHHIAWDGWSLGVFTRELTALYTAHQHQPPAALPALPVQYADYAVWQRQQLQGARLAAELAYWRHQLRNHPPALDLPTDRPRPAFQRSRGAVQTHALSPELSQQLTALSRQEDVTLFMLLLAAFKTLLYRYSGQEDVLIGSPVAGRNRVEIEGLIGFFVNTLVLRTNLGGNPSFRELLGRVRKVALEAYTHQHLPFEKLVEALEPNRDPSRHPLFQVMFTVQNAPAPEIKLPDIALDGLTVAHQSSKFDLSLDIEVDGQSLQAVLEYNIDLFDTATITRMLGQFETLLTAIIADPGQPLARLPLLSPAERQQAIITWNPPASPLTQDVCIHHMISAQAARTPDAIALVMPTDKASSDGAMSLTYAELDHRTNQLAHYLRAQGVVAGSRVVVYLERSVEMVIGLLGVLKAGAAYVPLDAAYAKGRLNFVLTDAQASLLLTQERLSAHVSSSHCAVLHLDTDWPLIATAPSSPVPDEVTADHLAYLVYTSGSTGQPKGVLIPHRSLVSAFYAWEQTYNLAACRAHLQMASFSFDVFEGDLVRALCSGAKLVLCPWEVLVAPEQLYALLRREQSDCAEFVPAVMRTLAQYLEQTGQSLAFMRLLAVGSDSWYGHEFQRVARLCGPATRLINSYGVSEATIDSSYFEQPMVELRSDQLVPIGRPFINSELYVLDGELQPVPIGVAGELYIGGAGLAYGYVNQPALTAEKFVPHPFSADRDGRRGARLYKTGDLAAYLPDGTLTFLGRSDDQVKLHGFRIELGEIEATLGQHPAVREAVVLARDDAAVESSAERLVAYVIPDDPSVPTPDELRAFVKDRLPSYMVPNMFVLLSALPLTSNGKVDRRQLPMPDWTAAQTNYQPPRTAVEQAIVEMWQELLGVERVGVHDNFFERGGHSLIAPQLILRLHDRFGVDWPLRYLFEAATVAEIAQAIEVAQREGVGGVPIESPALDLGAEAVLDPSVQPPRRAAVQAAPGSILLTGATGFLGAYLLRDLLERTSASIYVLIRATTLDEARHKLQRNRASYGLADEQADARVIPVLGDLTQPLLGLGPGQFQALAEQTEYIYHCGAWVNFTYPYQALKPTNVTGTQEILRLASQSKAAQVHYISTLNVFAPTGYAPGQIITEDDPLEHHTDLANGYAQSKWVAEKLMMQARERGLPTVVYRLGTISGDSQTAAGHPIDLIWALLKGCIQLGSAPAIDLALDLIPVDHASRAIIQLSQQPAPASPAFHLFNPQPVAWRTLVDWTRSYGYALRLEPYDQWQARLLSAARDSGDQALLPFISLFPSASAAAQDADPNAPLQFSYEHTRRGLGGEAMICPPITEKLLHAYLRSFTQRGFLKQP